MKNHISQLRTGLCAGKYISYHGRFDLALETSTDKHWLLKTFVTLNKAQSITFASNQNQTIVCRLIKQWRIFQKCVPHYFIRPLGRIFRINRLSIRGLRRLDIDRHILAEINIISVWKQTRGLLKTWPIIPWGHAATNSKNIKNKNSTGVDITLKTDYPI